MDVGKFLAQLRGELDLIERAIASMEDLGLKGKRGRGRPLGLVSKSNQNETMKASSELLGRVDH
jgi:hypothetical protein